MAADDQDAPFAPPPSAADLVAIAADDWAWLLTVLRRALHGLRDEQVTPQVERFRAAPASRLAGGRMRTELARLIAAGGPVWHALRTELETADVPSALGWILDGTPPTGASRVAPTQQKTPRAPRSGADPDTVRKLKERARALQSERDDARRRLAGAEARAEAAEVRLAELEEALAAEQGRVAELRDRIVEAEAEQARAVERERRRGDGRVAELEDQLREIRRRDESRRQERAREARAREAAEERERAAAREAQRRRRQPGARVVPGRPTRLPRSIVPGTKEEAAALLGPGRLVLLDGYNITLNQRRDLTLEEQRQWLVRKAASLAARRRVQPTVVFDGRGGGGSGDLGSISRDVRVVFTPDGVTADDEIVLAVLATDEPVVVVTDDNGLRDRVRGHGADLLRVDPFLWASG